MCYRSWCVIKRLTEWKSTGWVAQSLWCDVCRSATATTAYTLPHAVCVWNACDVESTVRSFLLETGVISQLRCVCVCVSFIQQWTLLQHHTLFSTHVGSLYCFMIRRVSRRVMVVMSSRESGWIPLNSGISCKCPCFLSVAAPAGHAQYYRVTDEIKSRALQETQAASAWDWQCWRLRVMSWGMRVRRNWGSLALITRHFTASLTDLCNNGFRVSV